MKKILLGFILGLLVAMPAVAIANDQPPFTNVIYDVPNSNAQVSVFDDRDNKCYVVQGDKRHWSNANVAISCLKRGQQ